MVYEPQEDSTLLAKHVAKLAYGKVLDMGTGSGIQARTAADSNKVARVLATDVDPKAVSFAKKENPHKKISYKSSDLFSKVKGKFDTIIINPPYLPGEQGLKDIALVGGKHGYELMCEFLMQALDHLDTGGQILASYSSLTKPEKVEECARRLLYDFEELDRQHIFFEDLLVVKFTVSKTRRQLEIDGFSSILYLAKGKRGVVFTGKYTGKGKYRSKGEYRSRKVAIKVKNPSSMAVASVHLEAEMLKRVNALSIGPELIKASDLYVAYLFVDGDFIMDFIEKSSRPRIIKVLEQVLDQCRRLDQEGISKEEMTRPVKHVIVPKFGKPVMIDFERAHFVRRPHNVTQFCQFLTSGLLRFSLASKKIAFDSEILLDLAKEYSKDLSEDSFNKIVAQVR